MLPPGYFPPAVGAIDDIYKHHSKYTICWHKCGINQLPLDERNGSSAVVVCTLPKNHNPSFHVAHGMGGIVLAVVWPDSAYQLQEGL